jgi:hypothetical protein
MSRQRALIFWPIPLRKDREHSWKHHCHSGLTRELLGWIDVMAAKKEAETGVRFVFAKRETLLTKCFKGKRSEGKHYSIQHLDRALAELRQQHIISQYRKMADGRLSFVVAPHDSLCRVEKDGKTCLLVDRSAWDFVDERPNWRQKVLAALKERASGELKGERNENQSESGMRIKGRVLPAIDESQRESQRESGQSLYDANFALLTDQEKADWLANGMQLGASTRCTRLSDVPAYPSYPSYPGAQDDLQRHDEFLKNHKAKKQQQEQPQEQVRESEDFQSKPNTVEATATATPKGERKRRVLSANEYEQQKVSASLAEEMAEYEARPLCSKCGFKHVLEKACLQRAESKRKK